MSIDLYWIQGSPPCAAIKLLAKSLGLTLNLKFVDMEKSEHLTPEFLKLNPRHQVPVVNDNGFVMVESRAILQYLVDTYAKTPKQTSLYPKDTKKRYLVDKILNFDLGSLYATFADAYYASILTHSKLDQTKVKQVTDNLGHLQGFLESTQYSAGDEITIADISLMAGLECMVTIHDFSGFPKVTAYMDRCRANMDGYDELCKKGADEFAEWAKAGLAKAAK